MVWKKKTTVKKTLKILWLIFNSSLDYTASSFSRYVMHELIESGIKLKSFCKAEETINKMKTTMEWEKILANHTSDKALIYKIYKEPI